jgi:predicted GNAT superfamily acetyltransferase
MTIRFRKLTEKSELQALEALQAAVWSEASVIPLHMTLTLAKFGGLFLGAYDDDKLIGFLYSVPGYSDGEPHLLSHMLGFLPEYRKQGLGVQMKWLQREESLRLGHRKITWTYDPLETVNASLNIAKLGGIVRRYLPDCYGELNDAMNRGLPTDRFLVEWFIASERVERYRRSQTAPVPTGGLPRALHYDIRSDGLPVPHAKALRLQDEKMVVPVPAFFQQVKQADMKVAAEWRSVTGEIFMHCFANGYHVTDVYRDETEPMVWYMLQKRPLEQLLA